MFGFGDGEGGLRACLVVGLPVKGRAKREMLSDDGSDRIGTPGRVGCLVLGDLCRGRLRRARSDYLRVCGRRRVTSGVIARVQRCDVVGDPS